MPNIVNPGSIQIGPGKISAAEADALVLITKPGSPGSMGSVGYIPAGGGTPRPGLPPLSVLGGLSAALNLHLDDPKGAHMAVAIGIDGQPPLFESQNVEGALDELMGAISVEPPKLGCWAVHLQGSGIPDWGALKLIDSDVNGRVVGGSALLNTGDLVYPYYLVQPSPALDAEFNPIGADPVTDLVWNISHADSPGGGSGLTFAGGFSRDPGFVGGPLDLTKTLRIYERQADVGLLSAHRLVCVSGTLFPADRGVLALIHWPANGDTAAFLAQDLQDRCVAALLAGQGILGDTCFDLDSAASAPCDGGPGGIFGWGTNADGEYDPFSYPGRASGQYNLRELYTGVSEIDGTALRSPWDDLDGDGVPGAKRFLNGLVPAPGQVRLGTDPTAGGSLLPYGIPVLGADGTAYSPVIVATLPGRDPAGDYVCLDHTLLVSGNLFRYRLPYLDDYSPGTGLKYTPKGTSPYTTKEVARYFFPADPHVAVADSGGALVLVSGVPVLAQAGNYANFPQDYWTWQVARFRHSFAVIGSDTGRPGEMGSYWLIHFQKEKDFESFVRDGILPNDVTDGYPVFGASLVGGSAPEALANLVNEETSLTAPSPLGPAPDYGYAAETHHTMRARLYQDDEVLPAVTGLDHWQLPAVPPMMLVSGVAYILPTDAAGAVNLQVTLPALATDLWNSAYRVDDSRLTGNPPAAPALLSSPDPMFFGLAPLAYEPVSPPTYAATVNGAAISTLKARVRRAEVPLYRILDALAGTVFSDVNAPAAGDGAYCELEVEPTGDRLQPVFSTDPALRVFFRKPLGHALMNTSALPYVATNGHGFKFLHDGAPLHATAKVLYHSALPPAAPVPPTFGNWRTAGVPSPVIPSVIVAEKDVSERFLDEVYRYRFHQASIETAFGPMSYLTLMGPGMNAWGGGFLPVPVQAGVAVAPWALSSWVQNNHNGTSLVGLTTELQVAGLPHRNPPLSNNAQVPIPSSGLLRYPSVNYSIAATAANGYYPDAATDLGCGALGTVQPSYVPCAGTRGYVRCFDVGFVRDPLPVAAAGQPFVVFRLDGVMLRDFAYNPPGPGGLGAVDAKSGLAIQIKVPGLTTWMDLGRLDGDGPSKQDVFLDGAGCQVGGPNTFDAADLDTGILYCQVQANVGPAIVLVPNPAYNDEVPVLVRVQMSEKARAVFTFDRGLQSPDWVAPTVQDGWITTQVRGLVGIRLVRLDLVAGQPTNWGSTLPRYAP